MRIMKRIVIGFILASGFFMVFSATMTVSEWRDAYYNSGPFGSMRGDALEVVGVSTVYLPIRLSGIDVPTLKGQCRRERKLAQQGKAFTRDFLKGREITLVTETKDKFGLARGFDRYGRLQVRIVASPGGDLATALIKAGLARQETNEQPPWC